MASTWSASLTSTQIHRQCGIPSRDANAFSFNQEQQTQCGILNTRHRGIRPKQKKRNVVRASAGDMVEDESMGSSKEENVVEKGDSAGGAESAVAAPTGPFVGAKISSRIAARVADSPNGRSTGSTATPNTFTKTSSPKGLPTANSKAASSQVVIPPMLSSLGKPTFSPKPISSQSFSPKPQRSPFSPSVSGADKLKEAKSKVFLDSRAGEFKQPGPKSLLGTLRESDGSKNSSFGQPIVPTNLFDEPEKLTAEEKRFDFSFNAGQLVLIFSFLTIIGIMVGTAFVVWKAGGIHYNEF